MFVKIDTRPDFRILRLIIPQIHANMAEALGKEILGNMDTPPYHLILDMDKVTVMDYPVVEMLYKMQALALAKNHSFFISNISNAVTTRTGKTPAFEKLNKVPTLAEAMDLVMMEQVERDLMKEEE